MNHETLIQTLDFIKMTRDLIEHIGPFEAHYIEEHRINKTIPKIVVDADWCATQLMVAVKLLHDVFTLDTKPFSTALRVLNRNTDEYQYPGFDALTVMELLELNIKRFNYSREDMDIQLKNYITGKYETLTPDEIKEVTDRGL